MIRAIIASTSIAALPLAASAQAPIVERFWPPILGTVIAVPANTVTPIWTFVYGRQALTLSFNCPAGGIIATVDGSASWLSQGGYDWGPLGDKMPNQSLTFQCSTATTVYVAEGQ